MSMNETLLKLMCIPTSTFQDVVKTSDGYYLGMAHGDIGYNAFLGQPRRPHEGPGRDSMLRVWTGLTRDERLGVLMLAQAKGVDLHGEFGVPREGHDAD